MTTKPRGSAHRGHLGVRAATVCGMLLLVGWNARTVHAQEPVAAGRGGRRGPVRIGSVIAPPALVTSGQLTVPAGSDAGTFIPITVIHGAKQGPILVVIAGIHGSETAPVLALQQMVTPPAASATGAIRSPGSPPMPAVDPMQLAGTVVLVHVANIPSFLGRSAHFSPADGKNLNRQFPGRADGTLSERIADVLTRDVIAPADYVVDLHSGANEDRLAWTGFYASYGGRDVIDRSRAMAAAFGLAVIVELPLSSTPDESARDVGSAAAKMGKPFFEVEVGQLGRTERPAAATIARGLLSVLRHLDMLPGSSTPALKPWFVTERVNVKAAQDGLFYPLVKAGTVVKANMRLGFVTDFHGARVQDVTSPASGTVLALVATPPINRGETLVTLAVK